VVGEVAVACLPQSRIDTGGRHAARVDTKDVSDTTGQWVPDAHLPRGTTTGTQTQVAAAVDGVAPVAGQACAQQIGRPSLDRAAQVEGDARWPADHPRRVVNLHVAPLRGGVCPSRATGRRRGQRGHNRRWSEVRA
jgi:hypothetical protein